MKFLRIEYPGIAWQTASIMIQAIGAAAILGYIAGMPVWTWPLSLLCLAICFYSGYYFNLGFRQRRFAEFRYGGESAPKPKFDMELWRNRRDANKENKKCEGCGKIFCPIFPTQIFCSEECLINHPDEFMQTLGDA